MIWVIGDPGIGGQSPVFLQEAVVKGSGEVGNEDFNGIRGSLNGGVGNGGKVGGGFVEEEEERESESAEERETEEECGNCAWKRCGVVLRSHF